MTTFFATMTPMLTLFTCMVLGYLLCKFRLIPDNASKTMARLEYWLFCPALTFMTMVRYFTGTTVKTHGINIMLSGFITAFALALAIFLASFFVKEKNDVRSIYCYALMFGNFSYMGDPIVLALFGEKILAYYKLFCLPLYLLVYTWGISILMPKGEGDGLVKRIFNPSTISMLCGITVGFSGVEPYIPDFIISTLDSLKVCMGPVAMLLAGVTIAKFNLSSLIKDKKVYILSLLRLAVLPLILISALWGFKEIVNLAFPVSIGNDVLFLALFAFATPLGLNTVVFPEAYGGDPKVGAGMALVSHTLCVISIPLAYTLMVAIFGIPFVT